MYSSGRQDRRVDLVSTSYRQVGDYMVKSSPASRIETLKRIVSSMPQQCAGTSAALMLIATELEELQRKLNDDNRA